VTLYQMQKRLFGVKRHERIVMFGELERIWEEAVVACFRVLSCHSPGGTEENISQDSHCHS